MTTRTIETKVFTFDELDDMAKDKAREWYRHGAFDYEWWDSVYEDAATIGKIMGIELDAKCKHGHAIWFSGFYHQGSGSAFNGHYSPVDGLCEQHVKRHAPQDKDLHAIAHVLDGLPRFLKAHIATSNRESSISVDVYVDDEDMSLEPSAGDQDDLVQVLRVFNAWIYSSLEKEYEWLNADAQIDDNILANEYTFTENGERFG